MQFANKAGDGVSLRVQSGRRMMGAVRVSHDVQPASLFEPPRLRRGMTDGGPPNPPRGSD